MEVEEQGLSIKVADEVLVVVVVSWIHVVRVVRRAGMAPASIKMRI